ncbi:tetratricopeptide repeat (TPR)-like superfamily protein [Wolffia australiana]
MAAAALPPPLLSSSEKTSVAAGRLGGAAACMIKTGVTSGHAICEAFSPFNSVLRSLSEARLPRLALLLYCEALCLSPPLPADPHTFPALLAASAALPGGGHSELSQLHALSLKTGFSRHTLTSNSLLHAYAVSGLAPLALHLFDRMPSRDAVSWNSVIKAHVAAGDLPDALRTLRAMPAALRNIISWTTVIHGLAAAGSPEPALELFREMQFSGLAPDSAALSAALSACAQLGAVEHALWAAVFAARRRLPVDPPLACTLIDALCKCGEPDAAIKVFCIIGARQHALEAASGRRHLLGGEADAAMAIFKAIGADEPASVAAGFAIAPLFGGEPDAAVFVLSTIAADKPTLEANSSPLLSTQHAAAANVRVWTAMISGLGANGRGRVALALFEVMLAAGITPNELTVTAALAACAFSGQVAEGKAIFRRLEKGQFRCKTRAEHLGCMAQILARAGELDQARAMAERGGGAVAFGALATACRDQADWQLGKELGEILLELDSSDSGRYVGLAAVLAGAGRRGEAAGVRQLMKRRGVRKMAGCSTIAVGGVVHNFVAGDRRHPRAGEIYRELGRMMERLKEAGYEPDRGEGVGEHSEKLAMAFGLISTKPGARLQILKNLRVCQDCHTAAKLVSKVYGRRIVMRDRLRFHHFEDGSCSCGDRW